MKKSSALMFVFIALVLLFSSCSSDVSVRQKATSPHSDAFNILGRVSKVYSASGTREVTVYFTDNNSRYFTGQELVYSGHRVLFEADIVEYDSIDQRILDYVDGLEANNALMHQNYPGFGSEVIDPEKKYVEFATYTEIETGEVLLHEVRIFVGDYMNIYLSGNYYAKSVSFSPDMTIDINRKVNVFTGEKTDYRIPQGSAVQTTRPTNLKMRETEIRKNEFAALGDVNRVFAWYDGEEFDFIHMFGGDDTTAECYLVELNSLSPLIAAKFASRPVNGLHQRGWDIESEAGKEYVEVVYYYTKSTDSSWASYRLRAEKMVGTHYGYKTKCLSDSEMAAEEEYDPVTGLIKKTEYRTDGTKNEYEYNPNTGNYVKSISYRADGTKSYEYEFDQDSGKQIKRVDYNSDGNINSWTEYEYDPATEKQIKRITYSVDGTKVNESEYDSVTGKQKKRIDYNSDGSIKSWTEYEYDANSGKQIKSLNYYPDGSIESWFEYEYDPATGKQIRRISFNADGTKSSENEYDLTTGKQIKRIYYSAGGIKNSVIEYDLNTGKQIKSVFFNSDGSISSWSEHEYDSNTGKEIKWISYNADGTKSLETENDPNTGKEIKWISYNANGTKSSESEYDPNTGNCVKSVYYDSDGRIKTLYESDSISGQCVKEVNYFYTGNVYRTERLYDKDNGSLISETSYDADGNEV